MHAQRPNDYYTRVLLISYSIFSLALLMPAAAATLPFFADFITPLLRAAATPCRHYFHFHFRLPLRHFMRLRPCRCFSSAPLASFPPHY
jgi:hypothetical protein